MYKLSKLKILQASVIQFGKDDRTTVALWFLIGVGLVLHAVYPLVHSPMDHLFSDAARHYHYSLGPLKEKDYGSYLELLGYQIWLYVSLNIVGRTPLNTAIYSAVFSMLTPLIWYRWFLECLPTKRWALFALSLLILIPSWITIYGFFMSETLLLPLLGLSLWLTWRAKRIQSLPAILLAIAAWFFGLCTKFSIVPEMLVSMTWLFYNIAKSKKMNELKISLPIALISTTIALAIPAMISYLYIGTAWLVPPGGIYSYANAGYCLSGAKSFTIEIRSPNNTILAHGDYAGNVAVSPKYVLGFDGWPFTREGNYSAVIYTNRPPSLMAPRFPRNFVLNTRLFAENVLSFFFSHSWPECDDSDLMQRIQMQSRLIWFPITLITFIFTLWQRKCNIVVFLSLFTAVCFCLQTYVVMEGRYRKPWEGLAIAALVSILASGKFKGNPALEPS